MPDTELQPIPEQGEEHRGLASMSFLEHLEELRRRIIFALLFVGAGFGLCWYKADVIYRYMKVPIDAALARHHQDPTLYFTNPTEPFNIYLKIGLVAGLFVASPFVLYQLWAFIAPGLYRHEKRYVLPFMFSSVGLFLAGGLFGYKIAFPAALDFLIGYGEQFRPIVTVGEYTDLFLTIMVGLGLIFELPIVVFFLALMGLVTPGWMWRNLRYSILVIFVIAAIVTPTTDITNMCIFAAPMVALYILSIAVAWLVHPATRRKRAAKSAK